jgi:hypothetical protein
MPYSGGVDVPGGMIDLEFRVTILEKIIERLLHNTVVASRISQREIQELWDQTFKELQSRYPNMRLQMNPPSPQTLAQIAGAVPMTKATVEKETAMGDVFISTPQGIGAIAAKTKERWERALRARLPHDRSWIIITDVVDGDLRLRSAHSCGGEIGDFTDPAREILGL